MQHVWFTCYFDCYSDLIGKMQWHVTSTDYIRVMYSCSRTEREVPIVTFTIEETPSNAPVWIIMFYIFLHIYFFCNWHLFPECLASWIFHTIFRTTFYFQVYHHAIHHCFGADISASFWRWRISLGHLCKLKPSLLKLLQTGRIPCFSLICYFTMLSGSQTNFLVVLTVNVVMKWVLSSSDWCLDLSPIWKPQRIGRTSQNLLRLFHHFDVTSQSQSSSVVHRP